MNAWKKFMAMFQPASRHGSRARQEPRNADRKRKAARKTATRSRKVNENPGVMMRRRRR
jgi:hypothetical protein